MKEEYTSQKENGRKDRRKCGKKLKVGMEL
jgi:hypothetical protein